MKRPAGCVMNTCNFARHFHDETVDTSKISAEYTDGILHVVLPKNEKAKPRLLAVINVK